MALRGATATSLRMSAPISPADSATPTPSMATMITPTALKFMKFGDDPLEHEADAFGRQEALDGGRGGLDLAGLRVSRLVGDARPQQIEDVGEHGDQGDQEHEDHHRVRDLVADPLHGIEHAGHALLLWRHLGLIPGAGALIPVDERTFLRCVAHDVLVFSAAWTAEE